MRSLCWAPASSTASILTPQGSSPGAWSIFSVWQKRLTRCRLGSPPPWPERARLARSHCLTGLPQVCLLPPQPPLGLPRFSLELQEQLLILHVGWERCHLG